MLSVHSLLTFVKVFQVFRWFQRIANEHLQRRVPVQELPELLFRVRAVLVFQDHIKGERLSILRLVIADLCTGSEVRPES